MDTEKATNVSAQENKNDTKQNKRSSDKSLISVTALLFILFSIIEAYRSFIKPDLNITMLVSISISAVYIFSFVYAGISLIKNKKNSLMIAFALEFFCMVYSYYWILFNSVPFMAIISVLITLLRPISMIALIHLSENNRELAQKLFFVPASLWLLDYALGFSFESFKNQFTSLDGILYFISNISLVAAYLLTSIIVCKTTDKYAKPIKKAVLPIINIYIILIAWIVFWSIMGYVAKADAKHRTSTTNYRSDGTVRDLDGDGRVDNKEWEKQWNDYLNNQYDKYGV